jgi:hypothetical protein
VSDDRSTDDLRAAYYRGETTETQYLAAERAEEAAAQADRRSVQDLRDARAQGEHVTKAMFRAATEREDARFEKTLAEHRTAREKRIADPNHDTTARAEERAADREQAQAEREQHAQESAVTIEQMRLARQDSRTPGGLPLAR